MKKGEEERGWGRGWGGEEEIREVTRGGDERIPVQDCAWVRGNAQHSSCGRRGDEMSVSQSFC